MTSLIPNYNCLVVNKSEDQVERKLISRSSDKLTGEGVTIRVTHSSMNYKDALCMTGHPGVAKTLPIVPGIDAAGAVLADDSPEQRFKEGDSVMVFHAKFGTEEDGGYRQMAKVPSSYVYKIPGPLTAESAMVIGTAGFTAAQCVDYLIRHGVKPDSGPVVVSGATGGVGIFSVKLLSKLGYEVVASTGKLDRTDWLKKMGASEVIPREELNDDSGKPLLKSRWAGAIDSVGSQTLSTIVRSTKIGGCVTACGLAGGIDLPVSVYPFILRGVALQGIDTANIAPEYRQSIWDRLATDWFLDELGELGEIVSLNELDNKVKQILAGKVAGRTVVRID